MHSAQGVADPDESPVMPGASPVKRLPGSSPLFRLGFCYVRKCSQVDSHTGYI